MKKIKVYVDTSIIGGVFDSEFSNPTKKFFNQVEDGRFQIVISDLVEEELTAAPEMVREFFKEIYQDVVIIGVDENAIRLRECYLKANVVTKKSSNDTLHVAIATVNNCPVILSWNFKHIVHLDKIPLYNSINLVNGYQPIAIYSPLEVINYG